MVDGPSSAVIIDPAFLGDVVFDGPLVRAIKTTHPGCRVGIVVRPPAERLAARIVGVDRIHVYDKRGADRGLSGLRRLARDLAHERYEVAYIPHPSPRSALLAWWAGIERREGTARGLARLFLTRRARAPAGFVAARLSLVPGPSGLAGTLRRADRSATSPPRVGVVLGSAWATKRWSLEQAARLAARAEPARMRLVLIGAPWEAELFDAAGPWPDTTERHLDGSLEEMIDAIASLDALVGGDTGPTHIARALGVPVVALFGPTDERLHDFTAADRPLSTPLECRPCSPHGHARCPLGHHRCMTDLHAERVIRALEEMLG